MLSNSEPVPEGTVIMAENQYQGRGQLESTWHAEPGKNLTFSLYLKPSFLLPAEQFILNMAISLALCKSLQELTGDGLSIKWPNDIYYQDKKIGGMLIESTLSGNTIKSCVIGIGINVNQQVFEAGLLDSAGSIHQILHRDVNLVELLAQICSQIEAAYLKIRNGNYEGLREEYLKQLYQFNLKTRYRQNGEIIEGEIIDVSERGLLSMKTRDGIMTYNFKEIEFIKPQKK